MSYIFFFFSTAHIRLDMFSLDFKRRKPINFSFTTGITHLKRNNSAYILLLSYTVVTECSRLE